LSQNNLEKRFGVMAVDLDYITADQLIKAMTIQLAENLNGTGHRLIGEILVDLGYLTLAEAADVLESMGIPSALYLHQVDAAAEDPFS
jgi:hypothetical protein